MSANRETDWVMTHQLVRVLGLDRLELDSNFFAGNEIDAEVNVTCTALPASSCKINGPTIAVGVGKLIVYVLMLGNGC
jgi:hypothetical protein